MTAEGTGMTAEGAGMTAEGAGAVFFLSLLVAQLRHFSRVEMDSCLRRNDGGEGTVMIKKEGAR